MAQMVRHCSDCGGDRRFELHHDQPGECPYSPGGDCAEWSCTTCGAGLLIGVISFGYEPAEAAELRSLVA